MNIIDLSQPWGYQSAPFPGQSGPIVSWEKRLSSDRVNVQRITSTLHVGTHLDAPLHFVSDGKDIEALGLQRLYGEGVVVDVSAAVRDYSIITPELVMAAADIRPGDILFVHTGYHRYSTYGASPDEERYFCKHPGPDRRFASWALSMRLRLLGVDASSMDHPMNTAIRRLRPDVAALAAESLGRDLDEVFPPDSFQCMHRDLFVEELVHVENLGGDIEQVLNRRTTIGVFPWRFRGGEAALCRAVAFVE
jgi:kynurenine formamidase